MHRMSDLAWISRGVAKVFRSSCHLQKEALESTIRNNTILGPVCQRFCEQQELNDTESHAANLGASESDIPIYGGAQDFTLGDEMATATSGNVTGSDIMNNNGNNFTRRYSTYARSRGISYRRFHTSSRNCAITSEDVAKLEELQKIRKKKNKGASLNMRQQLSSEAKPRKVPSTRIGRLSTFGGLAAGMAMGTITEMTKNTLGMNPTDNVLKSTVLHDKNLERIVSTLCRVRGAALKLGQMLSIQDDAIIDPRLQEIFERVRQSADFMPMSQAEKVLKRELGSDWRDKFSEFDDKPFAAASIGQVHRGVTMYGEEVAVKIQYPGVGNSIDSDINNLVTLLKMWNVFPEKMFIEKFISVARKELAWECDYVREAECLLRFREHFASDDVLSVPKIYPELSSREILTTQLVEGVPLDQVALLDQNTRNFVGRNMLNLVMREIFELRFMQTDPNWSNFLYNARDKKLWLLDFGASREYDTRFVDDYIEVVRGAQLGDRKKVLEMSQKLGFLTGYEDKIMQDAHVDAVMILGEPFASEEPFDFAKTNTTKRIVRTVPIMLEKRLSPPPEETYSLHRKLSGGFNIASKLKSTFVCKDIFDKLYEEYHIEKSRRTTS